MRASIYSLTCSGPLTTRPSGGYWLPTELVRVTPGDRHLIQLREIIYPNIKPRHVKTHYPETFNVVSEKHITYEITLGPQDLKCLLLMTPHMFRSTSERRQRALNHDQLTLTVDVIFEELEATTTER